VFLRSTVETAERVGLSAIELPFSSAPPTRVQPHPKDVGGSLGFASLQVTAAYFV
jgi:hypothetical protein